MSHENALLGWSQSPPLQGTGDGVSEERLQELVYGQWLHADLQVTVDPGQACVPPAVLQNQSCHISGTFIVQVHMCCTHVLCMSV